MLFKIYNAKFAEDEIIFAHRLKLFSAPVSTRVRSQHSYLTRVRGHSDRCLLLRFLARGEAELYYIAMVKFRALKDSLFLANYGFNWFLFSYHL